MSTSPAHAAGNSTALLLMMAQVLERDCSAHFEQLVSQESELCKLLQNKTTVAIDVIQSLGSAVTASKTGNTGSHGFPPQPFPSKIQATKGHARAEQRQRSGDRPADRLSKQRSRIGFQKLREPPMMLKETKHHSCIMLHMFLPQTNAVTVQSQQQTCVNRC